MIGELHATYLFETADEAKAAWEEVWACAARHISLNRWSLDPTDPSAGRVVTVLTEEPARHEFEMACALLAARGRKVKPPAFAIESLREKRGRVTTDGRHTKRSAIGLRYDRRGRPLGPLRRPQG